MEKRLDWIGPTYKTTPGRAFGNSIFHRHSLTMTHKRFCQVSWSSNQKAEAVVHTVNQNSSIYEEVELRLSYHNSAHSITGYEFNFRATPMYQYVQIVRWNGPFGNFTYLNGGIGSGIGPGLHNGDVISATAVLAARLQPISMACRSVK